MQSDDPTVIRVLAVHADDVVSALEANASRDVRAVLRVTPPFNGRMRARLHLAGAEGGYGTDPEPLHVDPERLVGDDAPAYPTPDRTEDELRSDPEKAYTPEAHRDYHACRVERWRERVREHLLEHATVEAPAGPHEVRVATLG
ncbi:MAG: hypothetical protein V5A62_16115 [Haloarculaceae archaeon]